MFKESKKEVATTPDSETGTTKVESKEKLPNMNNFHFYLPGGWYRQGQISKMPNKKKVIEAVDSILRQPKFADVDFESIGKRIVELNQLIFDEKGPEKKDLLQKERAELSEKMRPVFEELLNAGFSESSLNR